MKTLTQILLIFGAASMPLALSAHCGGCGAGDAGAKHAHASKTKADIVTLAAGSDTFSTLVAAVKAAGLVETLQGDGPFTVFAPTDEAFAALPAGTVESLLKPENRDQLVAILTYHVVPAKVVASEVKAGQAPTVNGQQLQISLDRGKVKVNGATVIQTDLMASNGVIHVIDQVILPPAGDEVAMN